MNIKKYYRKNRYKFFQKNLVKDEILYNVQVSKENKFSYILEK